METGRRAPLAVRRGHRPMTGRYQGMEPGNRQAWPERRGMRWWPKGAGLRHGGVQDQAGARREWVKAEPAVLGVTVIGQSLITARKNQAQGESQHNSGLQGYWPEIDARPGRGRGQGRGAVRTSCCSGSRSSEWILGQGICGRWGIV